MNRNRTIAQQGGQAERRITRFLSSTSLAAAGLPLTLGYISTEPQANCAFQPLSPSEVVSRDFLHSIGF